MNATRFKILLGVAGVLLAIFLWNWISGWGLVTLHTNEEPLAKIIRSIERQAGIKIVTNADLTVPITMDVDRAPAVEALEVVASRLDANWTVGYAAGPAKSDVIAGISVLQSGERDENFSRFGFGRGGGGGGFGGMDAGDTVVDVRRISWKVSPADKPQLQSYLDQASQKTGIGVIVPKSWDPPLATVPGGGSTAKALRELIQSAKGELQEVFVLRVQEEERDRGGNNGGNRADRGSDGGFGGPGGRPDFNPEWMEERALARIEQLPKEERAQAKKDFGEMRDIWKKMRALPDDQRRAAMENFFNDPVVQEKMLNREMSRDARRSPEKRADRFRQYIQRKQQMKASS